MNAAICPRCTYRFRVTGLPMCRECAEDLRNAARRQQKEAAAEGPKG